jgi:hypothetical protein
MLIPSFNERLAVPTISIYCVLMALDFFGSSTTHLPQADDLRSALVGAADSWQADLNG